MGICLEWTCGGRCQVSPAAGWCAWSARPSLGRDLTLHRQLGTKLMRTQNFYSCFSLTAALPRAKVVTQTTSSLHCVGSARRWTWEEWGSQLAATQSQIMHAHLYFPSARFQLSAHSRKNDLHSCSEICDRCWRNKHKRPRPVLEHWRSRPCRRRGSRCHDVNRDWMSWL